MEYIYDRINQIVGDDPTQIWKCAELYDELSREKHEIQQKLLMLKNDIPRKINEATKEIDDMENRITDMLKELEEFSKTYKTDENEKVLEKLASLSAQRLEYSKRSVYFKTLDFIFTRSQEMKRYYLDNNLLKCVGVYITLSTLLCRLSTSQTTNLVDYLKEVISYWHNLLKESLTNDFSQMLKNLNYPFVARKGVYSVPPEDMKPKFQHLTRLLLDVELPEAMQTRTIVTSSLLIDFLNPSIPVSCLLQHLRKRFLFHFCGTKETNRPNKPEWMFTQILTWIKDHEIFLSDWVQPVYDGFKNIVKIEFMNGLVKLVTEKLHSDMIELQYDDSLFTHTLDESLGFHRELIENYEYPKSCASVLSVLTQAQLFVKWISLERKCAERRMDDMLNSSTVWTVITEDENEDKITECAEKFIILLNTITDRYSLLPQPGHRLQFSELQLDLVEEFRMRLVHLKRDDYTDILNSDLPAILNTIHYVNKVVREWETNTHFILLNHFKNQLSGNADESENSHSIFSEVTSVLMHFSDELVKEICSSVMLEISAKSRPYRKDRWNIMPPMNADAELSLTISGGAMFQSLTSKLHKMQSVISRTLFNYCWRFIASELSKMIINDVIMVNMFSKGGAQQIQFDVKRNIIPLFAKYTSKPEAHFKPLLEACELLCLDSKIDRDNIPLKITCFTNSQIQDLLDRKLGRVITSPLD